MNKANEGTELGDKRQLHEIYNDINEFLKTTAKYSLGSKDISTTCVS